MTNVRINYPARGILDYIVVGKRYRGKGVGIKLVAALEAELRRRRIGRIYVSVRLGRKELTGWWRRRGYKKGHNFILLEKSIGRVPW